MAPFNGDMERKLGDRERVIGLRTTLWELRAGLIQGLGGKYNGVDTSSESLSMLSRLRPVVSYPTTYSYIEGNSISLDQIYYIITQEDGCMTLTQLFKTSTYHFNRYAGHHGTSIEELQSLGIVQRMGDANSEIPEVADIFNTLIVARDHQEDTEVELVLDSEGNNVYILADVQFDEDTNGYKALEYLSKLERKGKKE